MNTTDKPAKENYEKKKFNYYITNPERIQREKIYAVLTLIIGIAFEILVYYMHVNYPVSLLGGIPVFALIVWILVAAHYIIFLFIGGSWALDLKNDALQEWNKNAR